MIKVAAQRPPDRAATSECHLQPPLMSTVRQWRSILDYGNLPKVRAWGIEVAPRMLPIEGRFLPPPRIKYKNRELSAMNG